MYSQNQCWFSFLLWHGDNSDDDLEQGGLKFGKELDLRMTWEGAVH